MKDVKKSSNNIDKSNQTEKEYQRDSDQDSLQTGRGLFVEKRTEDDGLPGIIDHSFRKKRKKTNILWLRY